MGAALRRGRGDAEEGVKSPESNHFKDSMTDPSQATCGVGKPTVPVTPRGPHHISRSPSHPTAALVWLPGPWFP